MSARLCHVAGFREGRPVGYLTDGATSLDWTRDRSRAAAMPPDDAERVAGDISDYCAMRGDALLRAEAVPADLPEGGAK